MEFRCSDLTVAFANNGKTVIALEGVSFDCRHGEFLSLIGPSGCGKTTLLRAVAGILKPNAGTIQFRDDIDPDSTKRLMVYQEDSLFPWMTVLENAAFGLEMMGVDKRSRTSAAREWLRRYGLQGREGAYPHEISAGMKQRVAVIRAFLSEASVLLMDEPFGALDSPTRFALQTDLLGMWSENGRSVLFVTHDVDEAVYLSDRVLLMGEQPGTVVGEVPIGLTREHRREAVLSEKFLAYKREILTRLEASASKLESPEEIHVA